MTTSRDHERINRIASALEEIARRLDDIAVVLAHIEKHLQPPPTPAEGR